MFKDSTQSTNDTNACNPTSPCIFHGIDTGGGFKSPQTLSPLIPLIEINRTMPIYTGKHHPHNIIKFVLKDILVDGLGAYEG